MEHKTESLREAYGKALLELGSEMEDVVVVGADTTESLRTNLFGERFPDRFFNVGIAEQNMVGVSAGLALCGKTVFCGTFMVFMERALDQIRNTIAYCNLDVKIVCSHAGITVGPDGGSHQTIEDIAMMRAIPRIRVVVPADAYSTALLVKEVAKTKGPFYMRLPRINLPGIYKDEGIEVGKAATVREGKDITIIACGIMVAEALKAADRLQKDAISARVIDCHTIKPIDESAIIKAAKDTGRIITAEDHNVMGGLGSSVAEVLSRRMPTRVGMVAVDDRFGESGEPADLMLKYGIAEQDIFNKAKAMMKPMPSKP